ncbi:hypothetical protein [Psychrobacter sp. M13]|uniref:hypothetical protein n=1 Tax=Psychrobacter sp. M13 TaxID=3067275 RepID=UPI00273B4F83|nr:hypothetical protein [Psychrobacter sp. M13]WLP94302.1 hypothetical protein Q9G97_12100 [Psychrobacter sp. M13]
MSIKTLPDLDNSLYPQVWEQQSFESPQALLMALLTQRTTIEPLAFTKQLQNNEAYQEWINTSVFGRYIQRSFAAIYHQSEDSFNLDIPVLFRRELMRHAQYLPPSQVLFVAGDMPKKARQEKLLTTTLNPATVIVGAKKLMSAQTVVNQIRVTSKQVLGFPIRHNKRTSERTRNEVLLLGFDDLRLVDEQSIDKCFEKSSESSSTDRPILLRSYELR